MSAYFVSNSKFFIAENEKNTVLGILKNEFSTFEKYRDAGVDDEEKFHQQFLEAETLESASLLAGWFGVSDMLNDEQGDIIKLKKREYMDKDPIDSMTGYLKPVLKYIRAGSFIDISSEGGQSYKVIFTGDSMEVEAV